MKKEEIIINQYQGIRSALNERLISQGYVPIHEEDNDPVFGTKYVMWSNNVELFRFTWDGKEQWFILEITEDLPIHALTRWEEIVVTPYDAVLSTETGTQALISDFLNNF